VIAVVEDDELGVGEILTQDVADRLRYLRAAVAGGHDRAGKRQRPGERIWVNVRGAFGNQGTDSDSRVLLADDFWKLPRPRSVR